MTGYRWRVFHADGPSPDPDITALLDNKTNIWSRAGADLWCCPDGTMFLAWAELPREWGPYMECPDYRAVVWADDQARLR